MLVKFFQFQYVTLIDYYYARCMCVWNVYEEVCRYTAFEQGAGSIEQIRSLFPRPTNFIANNIPLHADVQVLRIDSSGDAWCGGY